MKRGASQIEEEAFVPQGEAARNHGVPMDVEGDFAAASGVVPPVCVVDAGSLPHQRVTSEGPREEGSVSQGFHSYKARGCLSE